MRLSRSTIATIIVQVSRRGAIQSLSIGTTPRIGPLHGIQIDLALMEYDDARVLIEAIASEAKDEELDDGF